MAPAAPPEIRRGFTSRLPSAQAQLRTPIQALDDFAWTNPDEADNMTDAGYIISLINQRSDYQITLPATLSTGGADGALSYSCFTPPATAGTTVTSPSPTTCPSTQTQQTLVTYQATARIFLQLTRFDCPPARLAAVVGRSWMFCRLPRRSTCGI
jgi:hypothetical protein